MEEIVQKLDELIKAVNSNSALDWIAVLIPIALTIVIILQSVFHHRENKKMQQMVSDRDIKAQMHNDFLKIYDDIACAQNIVCITDGKSELILSNFDFNSNLINAPIWVGNLKNAAINVCQAANRARILIPEEDKEFCEVITNIWEKYKELTFKIASYFDSGKAFDKSQDAWNTINKRYTIPIGNYSAFAINRNACDDYIKLCATTETEEINKLIKDFAELLEYENFDKYFEKYLRIDSNKVLLS